ncbi:T9SS type A sorting domain-containing protein, partial [Lutimonas saemankumensis]|uniref:T9SS type A sorting domain-containing protein n=1 Tax=Lutimonas saemankumensis TaxID=483016 RepID=UPI001CD48040
QTGGDTYLWSTGETTQSITVSPTKTKGYEVKVKSGDCEDSDEVNVFVESLIEEEILVSAGSDRSICVGETVTLSATGGVSYKWSNGESGKSIVVNPTETTTFSVEGTDGRTSDTADVTVYVEDINLDLGRNLTIKQGEEVKLTASGGDTYEWSNGESTESIVIRPEETIIISVTAFKNGCQDSDSIQISVEKNIEEIPLNPSIEVEKNWTICVGEKIVLSANGNGSFKWSTGDEKASIEVSPKRTTIYTVSASINGKTVLEQVLVNVDQSCGEQSVNNLSIQAHPNPSYGEVNFRVTGIEKQSELKIYDINGRLVFFDKISDLLILKQITYNLSELPKGVYIVHVSNSIKQITTKILLI